MTENRVDDWIAVVIKNISKAKWHNPNYWNIWSFLASAFSNVGRARILARVNDPSDSAGEFLLSVIVPRMSTVTTDDLTVGTCQRLFDLYIHLIPTALKNDRCP